MRNESQKPKLGKLNIQKPGTLGNTQIPETWDVSDG